MASYVLIGLGGALGSLLRAWVAMAMARLTGPAFPWGTILINITGSFIIGFVAALTATDGRTQGLTELRTFLMVGFCGGFTTFSSFSLQTLDLARDGRAGQALGNVGLSVVLCLGSVAFGHYAGTALTPGRERAAAARTPAGRVALAVLDRAETAPAVLVAAQRLMALSGGGTVQALALRAAPATSFLPSEDVLTAEIQAELAARQDHGAGLRRAFDRWAAGGPSGPGGAAGWTEVEGPPAAALTAHGRASTAIVLARPGPHAPPAAHAALHAALFDTGRPVLLLPPDTQATPAFGRTIAIAWRDNDPGAAQALGAALPLLRGAARVLVLRAGATPPTVPAALEDAGIRATAVPLARGEGPVGGALLATAAAQGADLLVMGAYAHGEWREALLGGVTRHMLTHASLPVLLRHAGGRG